RAARTGKLDCVNALTKSENINTKDRRGRTPLIQAAIKGHLPVVKFLVERGADVNKVDADGRSALLAAARDGHLSIVEYLIEYGTDINQTDKRNVGLLTNLLLEGHIAAADSLLQKGVEANVVTDNGITPLLIAARLNSTRVARRLLDLGSDFKHRWKADGRT